MTEASAFRRIVVGVDERGLSDHAARAALELAGTLGAEVELVHAVVVPPAMWLGIDRDQLARMHTEALAHAASEVREHLQRQERERGLATDALTGPLRVLPGPPAKVLLERASETGADLIVLGAHEKRGVLDFGSTVRSVLHVAPCAVWMQPEAWKPIERMLVPVDLSEPSLAALGRARDLALALGAALDVLHVFVPPEQVYGRDWTAAVGWPTRVVDELRTGERGSFEAEMERFDWRGVEHREIFVEGSAEEQILGRQEEVELVVMATHGRTGLSGFLLGNVAHSVMRQASVPVLALRAAITKS